MDGLKIVFVCFGIGAVLVVLAAGFSVMSEIDMIEPSETDLYTGEIIDVDRDRILLSTGDIIFASGIQTFEWKFNQTYTITIDTYTSDRYGHKRRKIVKEVEER